MSEPTPQLREFLTQTPFFGGLEPEALDRFIRMLGEKSFATGDAVFKEGEKGRAMYVVHQGGLVACQAAQSMSVRLRRFQAGDFFGEMTLIEMQPRPYTVVVEEPAHLYELTSAN